MLKSSLLVTLFWWTTFMRGPIETENVFGEYDFIVVGCGTAGSVVASRLSEDPNQRILVIEAGASDSGDLDVNIPMYWPSLQKTTYDWNYKITPQQHTNKIVPDRSDSLPKGRVIGGSSTINGMMYIRGSKHDYDSWEDNGAIGWSWNQTEKYFRKAEGAAGDKMSANLGKDGPLKITPRYSTPMHGLIRRMGESLGYKSTDYHDEIEGISGITATAFRGLRQSAATAYIYPILQDRKERLHIVLNSHVMKITFDLDHGRPKATGVVFYKDGRPHFVKARKEVILSAGVIATPQLLMLSGIGPKAHLESNMVDVVVDSPGVGRNLQDHPMVLFFYHATNMSKNLVLNNDLLADHFDQYVANASGPWTTPLGQDTNIHLRTGAEKFSASTRTHPFPDVQMLVLNAANETAVFKPPQDRKNPRTLSFFASVGLAHPKSRGTVRLASNDPFDYPSVDPNYLSNKDDVSLFIEAIRRWERFENSSLFREIGARLIQPNYCTQYKASVPRTEQLYRCWLEHRVYTQNHHCCTAKMGAASDKFAVVDERLRVYGVTNLRLADASVMPHLTSANTQSPCYMIGERAADLIKEDWKIPPFK